MARKIRAIVAKAKYLFLPIFVLAGVGLMTGGQAQQSTDPSSEIERLIQENAELKQRIERIEDLLQENGFPSTINRRLVEQDKKATDDINLKGPRAWLEPKMGWVSDYTNNRIYAVDNTGAGYTMNVGIGTNTPLSRFHLIGDFYNQGFAGAKSNFNPGVTGWNNVATLNITTHGTGEENSVVLIFAHVQQSTAGGLVDLFIRVVRGTQVVAIATGGGFYDVWSGTSAYQGATLVSYDEPPPGNHTYTLQIENSFPNALGYNFFVVELKR